MFKLPLCRHCDHEVKPGEDLCWECLGEHIPLWSDLNFWVYSNSTCIDSKVACPTEYDPLTFTWDATKAATVTGLTVTGPLGTFSQDFSAINVVNGDSIQWTLRGCTIA